MNERKPIRVSEQICSGQYYVSSETNTLYYFAGSFNVPPPASGFNKLYRKDFSDGSESELFCKLSGVISSMNIDGDYLYLSHDKGFKVFNEFTADESDYYDKYNMSVQRWNIKTNKMNQLFCFAIVTKRIDPKFGGMSISSVKEF